MEIMVTQAQGRVPVTILRTEGDIDHSCFQALIDTAAELYAAGMRDLLLDLGGTHFMSSSGLVALQSIARMLHGAATLNMDEGWSTLRAASEQVGQNARHQHIKLLNVQSRIDQALETVGLKEYFEIYTDPSEAVASF